MNPDRFDFMADALESRREARLLRSIVDHRRAEEPAALRRGDRTLLNFSSNDYLGLAMDQEVRRRAARYAEEWGGGAAASRLVTGGFEIHTELEAELARFTGREAALLFPSGFQANTSILPALAGRRGLILLDRGCHNSLHQGARLSRARVLRFQHNDPGHLREMLAREERVTEHPPLIVTESLFSMDGDRAPLREIAEVAEAFNALLLVDDAHAVGVWGNGGAGLAAGHPRIDFLVGTFGKALGSQGAFVACSEVARSYLVNYCSGFIYSTAPSPATVGAASAALERVRGGAVDLPRYLLQVATAHAMLRDAGFDTAPSDTQIIPIRLGDEEEALANASFLEERGILVVAIRPPTVPVGTSRLRVSLTVHHREAHLKELIAALVDWREGRRG